MLLASFRGVFRLLALVMLADPTEQVLGNLVLRVGIMFPVSDDPGSVLVRRVECLGPDSVGMHPGIAFGAAVRIIVIACLKLVHELTEQLLLHQQRHCHRRLLIKFLLSIAFQSQRYWLKP